MRSLLLTPLAMPRRFKKCRDCSKVTRRYPGGKRRSTLSNSTRSLSPTNSAPGRTFSQSAGGLISDPPSKLCSKENVLTCFFVISCKPLFPCFTAPLGPRSFLSTKKHVKTRSEEHTSELQSRLHLVCRLLLE